MTPPAFLYLNYHQRSFFFHRNNFPKRLISILCLQKNLWHFYSRDGWSFSLASSQLFREIGDHFMALQILTIDKCLQTLKKNYGWHLLHFIKIVPKKYRIKWSFSPQMKSEIFVWPVKRKNCWCLKTKGYLVTSALIYRPDPKSVGLFLTGFINSKKSALEVFSSTLLPFDVKRYFSQSDRNFRQVWFLISLKPTNLPFVVRWQKDGPGIWRNFQVRWKQLHFEVWSNRCGNESSDKKTVVLENRHCNKLDWSPAHHPTPPHPPFYSFLVALNQILFITLLICIFCG